MAKQNPNNNVEIYEEDSIVTLYDDNDKPIEFYEVASVEYEGKFYSILQPVELIEDMEDDEAVIFEYDNDTDNDEKMFRPVFDEKLLDEVFSLYLKKAADLDGILEGGCTGCGCSGGACGVPAKDKVTTKKAPAKKETATKKPVAKKETTKKPAAKKAPAKKK